MQSFFYAIMRCLSFREAKGFCMTPDTSRCIFTEGSAVLQEGYLDRSVKELLAGDERFPLNQCFSRRAAAAGAEQLPGGLTMNSLRKRNLR
jgi:hypothetical protein